MTMFADRLMASIEKKNTPCVVGLDPRIDSMPDVVVESARNKGGSEEEIVRRCITEFHEIVIDAIADLVPAVKLQAAFYEQYGLPGIVAMQDTIAIARRHDLVVILDAKRNDIDSTAAAYASAYLGETIVLGKSRRVFDVDALTVSPYLGSDSLLPFIRACERYEKGIFILVKTSNPESSSIQDLQVNEGGRLSPLFSAVARLVDDAASRLVGTCGYSSIGAVVGATFPTQALQLRKLMPRSVFLVPGYGSQGGTAKDVVACFNSDGLGAIVNASRSITYNLPAPEIKEQAFAELLRKRVETMRADIASAIPKSTVRA
jgi:orotidine-5'-phosphate decarboxylase